MIISGQAIILITLHFSEDAIMSVITAIFQSIFQAIAWILPISESAHSSMFHDFAGRSAGTCSALTGVIHIGIAVGIVISFYKLFFTLFMEFFGTAKYLIKKNIKHSAQKPARSFMYMTLVSFVPMLLWLIPTGSNGFLFSLLRKTGYNATLLDDGIFIALTGALVLLASRQLSLARNNKNVNIVSAIVVGVASVFLVPVSGLSLIGGVFSILMLMGVSKKLAFRYSVVMSVPVLVVMGIVEICISTIPANVISIIIGIIIAIIISFVAVKVLRWIIQKNMLRYFGYYDISVGVIILVIGIFELALK